MNKKSNNSSEVRTRNWATIVYKDSAPENWEEILGNEFVQAFISPYHDKDKNVTGESKKAHWHVIIMFDSVKTEKQAKQVFDKINGVGCQYVQSLRGYTRYLCHLDNPEKFQYREEEVISLCGADYNKIKSLESDDYIILDQITDFVESNNVISLYLLYKYASMYQEQWKIYISNHTLFLKEYLKSKKWSDENDVKHIIDIHGEILI